VLITVLAVTRPAALRVRRAEWPLLAAYGLLGFFAVQSFYVLALTRLPVGLALLIQYLAPVLVALWVRVVRRTVLPRSAWLGAGLAVCGLAMVAQVWSGFRLDGLGTVFALGGAVGLASYFLLSERGLSADRDPLGLVAWGAVAGMVPLLLVTSPLGFPVAALGTPVPVGPWSMPAWAPLLWLCLVSTVAAYLTNVAALRYLPAQVLSVVSTLEVLVAAGVAWLLLGEELVLAQLAGGAVLLAGVVVVQLTRPEPGLEPVPGRRGPQTGMTVGTIMGRRR
jgi:drug/metabolite transporter (DMT)-like permease